MLTKNPNKINIKGIQPYLGNDHMNSLNDFAPISQNRDAALPSLMISVLDQLGTITMIGDDKKSYLQGQVTCDVVSLTATQSTLGAHCDAKGKVWSIFRLFHHNGGYALLQQKSAIDIELTEIKKYAIFSKVDIEQGEDVVLGLIGENAEQYVKILNATQGDVRGIDGGSAVKIDKNRWVLLVNQERAKQIIDTIEAVNVDESVWTRFDIEHAQPQITQTNQNEHIPQALNLQALNGISFSKGCYTGQETVARAKYRGINKRAMFIVSGTTSHPLPVDTPIELERAVGDNWRSAGTLMKHYQFDNGVAIGLIVLPNNLDDDVQLRLKDQPTSQWAIEALPYSLDDE